MKAVLTPQDDAQILARYLGGERVQDLAGEYGVSTPTIYNRIPVEQRRARGGGPRPAKPPATTATTAAAVPAPAATHDVEHVDGAAISAVVKTYRGATFGYYPPPCAKPRCGTDEPSPEDALPIAVTDYRSRLGRVLRFCTWHCLSRHAIRAELAGGDA